MNARNDNPLALKTNLFLPLNLSAMIIWPNQSVKSRRTLIRDFGGQRHQLPENRKTRMLRQAVALGRESMQEPFAFPHRNHTIGSTSLQIDNPLKLRLGLRAASTPVGTDEECG
jgi:hypothetical protein